ncbi:MAG: helix-turn-helix domain-containing protein [Opitutaceae bacterium]|nr:helix-turn-helix domain-containing protein [Opitutaceae bacterium]
MSRPPKNLVSARPLHVSVVALPESMMAPIIGIHEVLGVIHRFAAHDDAIPPEPRFRPEIVAPAAGLPSFTSELPLRAQRTIDHMARTDIIIVPSLLVRDDAWRPGRYPELVAWIRRMHAAGAELCSACSGVFVLAESGVWSGHEATIHWAYADAFSRTHPDVVLRPRDALVVSGGRGELISSGASTAWYDLVLFLIARHVGPTAAQAVARFLLVQWHAEGQAPYAVFTPPEGHGDALIAELQRWLEDNYAVPAAVEALVARAGLPERTLKRRFTKATGYAPLAYIQHLRIEEAKRRLERTDLPIDEISWTVGYEEPAFFRRLFKRLTALTPGDYRRRFRVPVFAQPKHGVVGEGSARRGT